MYFGGGGGLVAKSCLILATSWTVAHQASLSILCRNTGVDLPFLSLADISTQGSNLSLLHCRQILYHLSHQGKYIQINGRKYHIHHFGESTFLRCPLFLNLSIYAAHPQSKINLGVSVCVHIHTLKIICTE